MPFDFYRAGSQRIAVIGGGISGMACAWLLSDRHRVTLYEAEGRLGGHARTVLAGLHGDRPVDTGFIVFNYVNYPYLTRLFDALDVPVEKSDMSFAVSADNGRLEYALRSADAVFGQRRNVLRAPFHVMLRDIMRFNARAEQLAEEADLTIDELISRLGLGRWFRDYYLRPICGAIWSTPAERIGAFPARSLMRFFRNHALLSATGQHQWWTVSGGSVAYVSRMEAALRRRGVEIRSASPVVDVRRAPSGVQVKAPADDARGFDQVVFACHADTALKLIGAPSPEERASLGAVRFQDNRAILHRDPGLMPRRRRCWASWVYRSEGAGPQAPIGVSYWMNRLQNLPESDPLFLTLNPGRAIDEALIYDETVFRHPVFDSGALAAQARVAGLQGRNRSWFAGAWLRNGFHEDGFASAARIARRLAPVAA